MKKAPAKMKKEAAMKMKKAPVKKAVPAGAKGKGVSKLPKEVKQKMGYTKNADGTPLEMKKAAMKMKKEGMGMVKKSAMMMKKASTMKMYGKKKK